jgi:hypothetical protein
MLPASFDDEHQIFQADGEAVKLQERCARAHRRLRRLHGEPAAG